MIPVLLAVRENDRTFMLKYGYDLHDSLQDDMDIVLNTLDYAIEEVLIKKFGYEYDLEKLMENLWIKELYHQKELIQQHLADDNGYTGYQPYQLWIYGDSAVRLTLYNNQILIGRMEKIDEEDINHAWLEFRVTATAELKPIAFNDIKSVHKI
ncbi:hypothetical protein ERX35_010150 [Macrococcus equipercicus]|uniref:Uncharacterized protein n=1 Tax=Macrococcus equipercicus TaxID=69967 RepID=A0ABQ6R6G7_9STAP|nr:hypothetical protein [Macrococcus equipercicus]KAA1036883.1 hypothetical protein ERX35_010150 [Macrococcus equipercicus]